MDEKPSGREKLDALLCTRKICEEDLSIGLKYRKQTPEERLARPTFYGMAEYPMTEFERKSLRDHIARLTVLIENLQHQLLTADEPALVEE